MRNDEIIIGIAITLLIFVCLSIPVEGLPLGNCSVSPIGEITLSAVVPDSPENITSYRVIPGAYDTAHFSVEELEKIRYNLPSESDAPDVAKNILDSYGGLPEDAILAYDATEYLEEINVSTGEVIEKYPISTNVQYTRSLNEGPVVGEGAYINIDLGDNGELLYLNKGWKTVSPDGEMPIIPLNDAIQKLNRGEILNPKRDSYNSTIVKIRLGYYEKGRNKTQEYLDPAWLFRGTTESGDPIQYYVYARRFANFTATPVEVTTWGPVRFTDTSETNVTKWYWDFGDGTDSTEQNPSHLYRNGGNYTVNFTVWNDMGSDTISRPDYIHVYYTSPAPVASFTADYPATEYWDNWTITRFSPVTIQFTDTSMVSGNYTRWYWAFDDGTDSTEQNPVHVYNYSAPDNCGFYDCVSHYHLVNLTVFDSYNRSSTHIEYYVIFIDPLIDFNGEPTSGIAPLDVTFSEKPDAIPEFILGYRFWDFGDGSYYAWNPWDGTPVPYNVTHTYSLPGNYGVTFSKGMNDWSPVFLKSREFYVTVTDSSIAPVAEFSANITTGRSPLGVEFSDQSLNSALNWNWSFGDGLNSTDQNPVHVYSTPGIYTVLLTAANDYGGNTSTKIDYITVYEPFPPVANFTADPTTGYEPLSVEFNDSSENHPDQWNWTFGDGSVSSERNPMHVYEKPGTYSVSLVSSNEYGNDTKNRMEYITVLGASLTKTISVPPEEIPEADFTGLPVSGKEPLTVVFEDTSANFPDLWSWDFGDGTDSTETNPVHVYSNAGSYTVSLNVTNEKSSNLSVKTDYITVLPLSPPIAGFTSNTSSGKIPLVVEFTDTSFGTPTSWSWTFGDGETSADQNPVHVYTTIGQFTVSLQVTNEDGSNATTKEQFINGSTIVLPSAEFTANTTSGNAPLAVGFTDKSTGSPVSWQWSFGDGAISSEQNPEHIYSSAGTYTVSLEVTNSDGSNTVTKTDYIAVTSSIHPPVAGFTGKPTCGKAPLTVKFNDTSAGSPTEWYWNFGDGTSSPDQNPVHVYTTSGKYTVTLTVTNAGGSNTSTRKDYISVGGAGNNPPDANFYAKPTSGKAPLSVKFTDTSSGNPTTWNWEFGDGTNATGRNPVHSYTIPGKYTISLTVTNTGGSDTKTKTEYITVKGIQPPTADFFGKPTYGKAPLDVRFTDISKGTPTSWYWEFGDGTNGTAQNPVHSYTSAGKYTVSLTTSNAGGNTTRTRTRYVTVNAQVPTPTPTHTCTTKPTATCTAKPTTTCTQKP